jgi:hypothetical protein
MSITKADLEAVNADLEAANLVLKQRIETLEATLAATGDDDDAQRDELSQTLWLRDRYTPDKTRDGQPKITFGAQKSVRNQDGTRTYGPYKTFVAYAKNVDIDQVRAILDGDDRLVEITAFESPWKDREGYKHSDWVVTSMTIRPRTVAAAAPESFEGQPESDEEIPF